MDFKKNTVVQPTKLMKATCIFNKKELAGVVIYFNLVVSLLFLASLTSNRQIRSIHLIQTNNTNFSINYKQVRSNRLAVQTTPT